MNARQKLNSIWLTVSLVFAGCAGAGTESLGVFVVVLAVLVVANLHDGNIRTYPANRRRQRHGRPRRRGRRR